MTDKIGEEEYETIIRMAEEVAYELISQFQSVSPIVAASLQLGMVKSLAVVWSNASGIDQKDLFDKMMQCMPDMIVVDKGKYIN
jgi:hypothetical protein